jgi:hypothetical protein
LSGHPERAEVRARAVRGRPVKPQGFDELTIAWARLLQGEAGLAADRFAALEDRWRGDPIDLCCSRAMACAVAGRWDEAERLLATVSCPGLAIGGAHRPAWWAGAEAVIRAWGQHLRGEPVDEDALVARLQEPVRNLMTTAGTHALLAALGRSDRGQGQSGRYPGPQ